MFTSHNENDIRDAYFPASSSAAPWTSCVEMVSVGDIAHLKYAGNSRDTNWAILTLEIIYGSVTIPDASCTFEMNSISHAWHT